MILDHRNPSCAFASEAVVSGTEVTSDLYAKSIEMNRQALHSYLDAVEATLPRSDDAVAQIRNTIDEQFDQLEEQQQETLSMAEENVGNAEQSADAYLDALDNQLDILINAHERTETRTVEALEQIETQIEQIQEEAQEQATRQAEELQSASKTSRTRCSQPSPRTESPGLRGRPGRRYCEPVPRSAGEIQSTKPSSIS